MQHHQKGALAVLSTTDQQLSDLETPFPENAFFPPFFLLFQLLHEAK